MQLRLSCPKLWLATQAVDFRKSIDGLCEIIVSEFAMDLKESLFIFHSRDLKKLKILAWHNNGFVLTYKRLIRGRFKVGRSEAELLTLDEKQLSWLIAGLDWVSMSEFKELEFEDYF